jgi:uncharacterized peroxidase-related enzyme
MADISPPDKALCGYAEKLTLNPGAMERKDVEVLRQNGFDDRAIHDATQVIGYFNYINRVADALDIDYEKFIRPWESRV